MHAESFLVHSLGWCDVLFLEMVREKREGEGKMHSL